MAPPVYEGSTVCVHIVDDLWVHAQVTSCNADGTFNVELLGDETVMVNVARNALWVEEAVRPEGGGHGAPTLPYVCGSSSSSANARGSA